MLRDVANTRIQDGLGFRPDLADKINLRMQEEQRDLERGKTLPHFLLVYDQALALAADGNTVALPTDFLRRSDELIRYTVTDASPTVRKVPWRSFDEADSQWSDHDPAGPQVAVLRPSSIRFFPTADRAYALTWSYYKKADLLTSNIENLWLANAPELIIGGAGLRMAKDIRNKAAIDLFTAMYQQARQTWFNETVQDEVDDQPLILGQNN